jgi:hypothetical protein
MIIRDNAVGGATLFKAVAPYTAMQCTKYFNPPIECAPVIDISECIIGTPADAKVIIVLA